MNFKKATIAVLVSMSVSALAIGATGHGGNDGENKHAGKSDKDSHGSKSSYISKASHSSNKSAKGHAVHWGYTGREGPSRWGDLSSAYETCKNGKNQSPVNIEKSVDKDMDQIQFSYAPSRMRVLYNGHTIQVNRDSESKMSITGRQYKLLQFHFHSPSEHTYRGEAYPMEMHLVHQGEDGRLAVVGVFLKEGRHNAIMDMVLNNVSDSVNHENIISGVKLNPEALLPKSRDFYHYNGSLTTPPCSEGVRWFVMQEPIQLSSAQVHTFLSRVNENARPVQPLNRRIVKK